jgi:copper resistance protein D
MMHTLYLVSVWLHILAAIVWIGGMAFLVLVVVPWLRGQDRANAFALLRDTGTRFSRVGWTCFVILVVTGAFNLYVRGADFTSREFYTSTLGQAVMLKLAIFLAVLIVSAVHDFIVGPRAVKSASESDRKKASILGRLNALFALALVALGVIIVRGC